ncbi:HPr family phosphocarrier protein [Leptotrichia wadei]|jgi:Phosphotransferase System HPr (HPr) Family|uniref:HPr family phosphocarrier protein n=2 Tax=Leptotrichia wadei TaxID=157687 RepID=A0A7U6L9B1_9FUSO|nr:HPr family phosphocarrier protein [Leptotrichia wadei]ERK53862.1 phosphocarrier, HPr family [Leptotrichia wadei F0279]BBM42126.1 HPr family phosphocarrier protein [Leptotrichia wadei]
MKEIIVEIKNEQGIHARPSGQIVNIAKKYNATLEIEKVLENERAENNKGKNEKVDGKNVFGVMMLGAEKGEKLKLRAISENGENPEEEAKLLEELRQLIEINKFFE